MKACLSTGLYQLGIVSRKFCRCVFPEIPGLHWAVKFPSWHAGLTPHNPGYLSCLSLSLIQMAHLPSRPRLCSIPPVLARLLSEPHDMHEVQDDNMQRRASPSTCNHRFQVLSQEESLWEARASIGHCARQAGPLFPPLQNPLPTCMPLNSGFTFKWIACHPKEFLRAPGLTSPSPHAAYDTSLLMHMPRYQ